ncbi:MAG TPA: hypothetical protein VK586_04100, partial [Streptosporangiaceae bacterium]|nr:hypothetical protein [Streptosporangiaceae bacterium]
PELPLDSAPRMEAARQALAALAALESDTADLLTDATRVDQQEWLASAPEVTAAARQLLPYTGSHQADLTVRLDEAVGALARATPSWWRASPAELTTMADIDTVRRTLETDEYENFSQAARDFADVLTQVSAQVKKTQTFLADIAGAVRELLSLTGARQPALQRELEAAAFAMTAWPDLTPATVTAVQTAAAERTGLQPSFDRLEAAVRDALVAAADVLRPERAAALELAAAMRQLRSQAGPLRVELASNLDYAYRAVSITRLPPDPPQSAQDMNAAYWSLSALDQRLRYLRVQIRNMYRPAIAQPLRDLEPAIGRLAAEAERLAAYVGGQEEELRDQLREAELGLGTVRPAPTSTTRRQDTLTRRRTVRFTRPGSRQGSVVSEDSTVPGIVRRGTTLSETSDDAPPRSPLSRRGSTADGIARRGTALSETSDDAPPLSPLSRRGSTASMTEILSRRMSVTGRPESVLSGVSPTRRRKSALVRQPVPAHVQSAAELSAVRARLDRLRNPRQLSAVVNAALAGWAPRVAAARAQVAQAPLLLDHLGDDRRSNERQLALTTISAGLSQLTARPQPLPESPGLAEINAASIAMHELTRYEEGIKTVLADARAVLLARLGTARDLAAAARRLLPQTDPGADAGQDGQAAELTLALQEAGELPGLAEPLPGTAEVVDAVGRQVRAVARLETATSEVIQAAIAPLPWQRPRADGVLYLAIAAQQLLPHAGAQQDQLARNLEAATEGLQRVRPAWWPAPGPELTTQTAVEDAARAAPDTAPTTVEEVQSAVRALRPGALEGAIAAVHHAVADVIKATIAGWERTSGSLMTTARQAENLLPMTGDRRAALAGPLAAARASAQSTIPAPGPGEGQGQPRDGTDASQPPDSAEDSQSVPMGTLPEHATPAEMDTALRAMIPVLKLDAAIRPVAETAADIARPRVTALLGPAAAARDLLPLTQAPGALRSRLEDAITAGRALPARPGPQPSAAEAADAARRAVDAAAGLQAAITAVLGPARGRLQQRARAGVDFAGLVRARLPETAELSAGLAELDRAADAAAAITYPAGRAAAVRAARDGLTTVTALEAATRRVLARVSVGLRQRAAAATGRASAARGLLDHAGAQPGQQADQQADQQPHPLRAELAERLRAATEAVSALPGRERLPRTEEALDATRRALDAVTELETATRNVLTAAAPALGRLRAQVQAVQAAEAVPVAAAHLMPHLGAGDPVHAADRPAEPVAAQAMRTQLTQAAYALRARRPEPGQWPVIEEAPWPATEGELPPASDIEAAARALNQGVAGFQRERDAAERAVAQALTSVSETLKNRRQDVIDLVESARPLLGDTGLLRPVLAEALDEATSPPPLPQVRPTTLAGVEAASRDLDRMAGVEAAATAVVARVAAAAGLPQRVTAAPALAAAARRLLPHADRPAALAAALANAEGALPDPARLNLDVLDPPAPRPGGQPARSPVTAPDLARFQSALQAVSDLERASEAIITAATAPLTTAWRAVPTARSQATASRTLLEAAGQPEVNRLQPRINNAIGQLHLLDPRRWQPAQPGRPTVAEIEAIESLLTRRFAAPADLGTQGQSAVEHIDTAVAGLRAAGPAVIDAAIARRQSAMTEAQQLATRAERVSSELASDGQALPTGVQAALTELQDARRALAAAPALTRHSDQATAAAVAQALTRLNAALRQLPELLGTLPWQQAEALLDPGHRFTPAQADSVVAMVTSLTAGLGPPGDPVAVKFAQLASRIGFHEQDSLRNRLPQRLGSRPAVAMNRFFGFLQLATQVFDDGSVSLDSLVSLRRLTDLIRGGRAIDVTLADLEDEYRQIQVPALPQTTPVTRQQLRDLVRLAGQAALASAQGKGRAAS